MKNDIPSFLATMALNKARGDGSAAFFDQHAPRVSTKGTQRFSEILLTRVGKIDPEAAGFAHAAVGHLETRIVPFGYANSYIILRTWNTDLDSHEVDFREVKRGKGSRGCCCSCRLLFGPARAQTERLRRWMARGSQSIKVKMIIRTTDRRFENSSTVKKGCSMVILYGSLVRVLGQHMGWLPRRPNKSIMGRGLGFDRDSLLLLSKRSFKGNAFFPFIYSSFRSIVRVFSHSGVLYIYIYLDWISFLKIF